MTNLTHCSICREPFEDNQRLVFNIQETFIFKPAGIPDIPMTRKNKEGQDVPVSAAAVLSPDALAESRKEYQKTVVATVFHLYGRATIPEGAFNVRHSWCGVQGTAAAGIHPAMKHSIRYKRSAVRRAGRNY